MCDSTNNIYEQLVQGVATLADRVGFEPTDPFRGQHISSVLLSATQAPVLKARIPYLIQLTASSFECLYFVVENTFRTTVRNMLQSPY